MASSFGQSGRTNDLSGRGRGSSATRARLLIAAAELIAEVGWGRVTTRAVAARAGVPHGSVSYHFRGKQELLVEAAMHAFRTAMPIDAFEALETVEDLLGLIAAEVGDADAVDPGLSRLMLEAMREAEREPLLRGRMGDMMRDYRNVMTETLRAGQARGLAFEGASPEALATVLGAVGDGLLLHALLDRDLDVAGAIEALRALLAPGRPAAGR
jgi:AcrR family transcriptional regulator